MKKLIATGMLPLGALMAFAAPAQAESAATTINLLEAQGFDVRITRIGSAPLDQCSVISVRRGPTVAQQFPVDDDDRNVFTVVPKPKVSVALDCSR